MIAFTTNIVVVGQQQLGKKKIFCYRILKRGRKRIHGAFQELHSPLLDSHNQKRKVYHILPWNLLYCVSHFTDIRSLMGDHELYRSHSFPFRTSLSHALPLPLRMAHHKCLLQLLRLSLGGSWLR